MLGLQLKLRLARTDDLENTLFAEHGEAALYIPSSAEYGPFDGPLELSASELRLNGELLARIDDGRWYLVGNERLKVSAGSPLGWSSVTVTPWSDVPDYPNG